MSASGTAKTAGDYHHGNLREALVAAGLALLATQDSADISMRELARQVGVSPNATYRHFDSKEALLAAMASQGYRMLADAQKQAAMSCAHPVEMFMRSGCAYVDFARQHPALFRLMFSHFKVGSHSDEMKESGLLAYDGLRQGVAAALKLDPESDAVTIPAIHSWCLVHGLSMLILDGQLDEEMAGTSDIVQAVLIQAAAFGRQLAVWEKGT